MNYDFVKIIYHISNKNFNLNDIWYGYLEEKIYDNWYEFVRLKVNDEICTIIENFPIDSGYAIEIDAFDSSLDGIPMVENYRKIIIFS